MIDRKNISPIDDSDRVNWTASIDRFSALSPNEIVALSRAESVHGVTEYLDQLAREERDTERLSAVMTAFLDSSLSQDRMVLANGASLDLIRAGHHDLGMTIWDRLVRDEDEWVRWQAYSHIEEVLDGSTPPAVSRDWPQGTSGPEGFYAVTYVEEQDLQKNNGLTRQDAYDLVQAYAYAENGEYFNLGRAALAKLQAALPPAS